MRSINFFCSIGAVLIVGQQSDFTQGAVRVDKPSWDHALFGPYDPDEMESAPLQHILLEPEDVGFVVGPLALDVDTENAFHRMSLNYGEEDIIYQLEFAKNGFNKNETFAILQNGVSKCKLKSHRRLAPAQTSDDLRQPSARFAQEMDAAELTTAASDTTEFLGGVVDIMFVSGAQIKLQNQDFTDNKADHSHLEQDHTFAIKGRMVLGCECSHSHLEDTFVGLGKTRFAIRKLHADCPDPVRFKEAPTGAPDADATEVTTVVVTESNNVSLGGEL